ncbi:hypothetical protein [Chromobacterium violaceum]|uniref:hypothetical protein n=1 Tax=Chromobacterium violaceum TaxID=536 RepID=UPI001B344863|nr:hypothetical protein [Chromobacterium violaceum]MBP4045924.1 hypothetical protein [Chromobacterium violaceum]
MPHGNIIRRQDGLIHPSTDRKRFRGTPGKSGAAAGCWSGRPKSRLRGIASDWDTHAFMIVSAHNQTNGDNAGFEGQNNARQPAQSLSRYRYKQSASRNYSAVMADTPNRKIVLPILGATPFQLPDLEMNKSFFDITTRSHSHTHGDYILSRKPCRLNNEIIPRHIAF